MSETVDFNPQNEQNITVQDTANYRCPSCGAGMIYDANSLQMFCEYCNTYAPIEISGSIESNDLDFSQGAVDWQGETRAFSCENCAATTVLDSTEIAKECPYCGSHNILETEEMKGLKPQVVLPFHFDKAAADIRYHKWAQSSFLAPRKFKKFIKEHEVHGVYSPCWTFDSDTYSTYKGVVGDYYYVNVKTKDGYRRERRIRYRKVSGNYSTRFADVMVEASPRITQAEFQKIMPFDMTRGTPYDKKFLAGFSAEHYDKPLTDGWHCARGIIDSNIRSGITSTLRCDVVQSLNVSTRYDKKKYKYVMLPIYVGGAKYKEKLYSFFMNGISGKATGKTPKSALKILALVGVGLLFLVGAYFLMQFLGQG